MIYEWLILPILCLRLFGWHVMLKQCRAICLVSLLPNDPSVLSNSLHSKSRKFHLPIVYQICLKLVMFLSEVQHQKNTLLGVFWIEKNLHWNDSPYGKVVVWFLVWARVPTLDRMGFPLNQNDHWPLGWCWRCWRCFTFLTVNHRCIIWGLCLMFGNWQPSNEQIDDRLL